MRLKILNMNQINVKLKQNACTDPFITRELSVEKLLHGAANQSVSFCSHNRRRFGGSLWQPNFTKQRLQETLRN